MKKPTEITIDAWARLLRSHQSAFSAVEKALKDNKLPPLIWYDILLELDREGPKGMRPFELEKQLLLPQYGVSRIITRIEKAGYLIRTMCVVDGRGQSLQITPSGKELRRRMWPIYSAAIESAIGEKLSQKEVSTLSTILKKLTQ